MQIKFLKGHLPKKKYRKFMRSSVTVNDGLQKYCDKLCSTSGFNQMWLLRIFIEIKSIIITILFYFNPIHVNSHINVTKNYILQLNSTYSISGS